MGQERRHLKEQLESSRRQLNELKVEHQGLNLETIALRRDQEHSGKEVGFLRKLLDEGLRDAQTLQQSIEYLETSNQSLFSHTSALEEARKEILDQVRIE